MAKPQELSPWVLRGLYSLAALLVLWPMVDLLTNLWPMQPGNFRWRYGFAGLLGGFHLTPMFGYVLAMFVAIWARQPRMLKSMGALGFLGALFLLGIMIIFPLDTLQVRAERDPGVLPAVIAGAIIAESKHLTTFLVLLMLGRGSWATAAKMSEDGPGATGRRSSSNVLIASDKGGRGKREPSGG